jgi:deferrochelatase/peroxidase EfeB
MNVIEAITAYADAQQWITVNVKKCLTRPAELAKLIGIGKSQFYERIRKSSWKPGEMQKLTILLESHPKLTIEGPVGE